MSHDVSRPTTMVVPPWGCAHTHTHSKGKEAKVDGQQGRGFIPFTPPPRQTQTAPTARPSPPADAEDHPQERHHGGQSVDELRFRAPHRRSASRSRQSVPGHASQARHNAWRQNEAAAPPTHRRPLPRQPPPPRRAYRKEDLAHDDEGADAAAIARRRLVEIEAHGNRKAGEVGGGRGRGAAADTGSAADGGGGQASRSRGGAARVAMGEQVARGGGVLWCWLGRYVAGGGGRGTQSTHRRRRRQRHARFQRPRRRGRGVGVGAGKKGLVPPHPPPTPPLGSAHGGQCEHHASKPSCWTASHTPPPPHRLCSAADAPQTPHRQAGRSVQSASRVRVDVQPPLRGRGWRATARGQRPAAVAALVAPAGGAHDAAGRGPHRPVTVRSIPD